MPLFSTIPYSMEYFRSHNKSRACALYLKANLNYMKKNLTDFRVVENLRLTDRLFLLKLTPADGSPIQETRPGQFVEVRVDDEPKVFLRRPISIHRVLPQDNQLWLLVQKVGNGTNKLSELNIGETLNIVYPLGNGYTLNKDRVLLIGGGVGIAPLLEAGAVMSQAGARVTYLLGARTAQDLVELDLYKSVGEVLVTTEDGSMLAGLDCQKGFVTNHSKMESGLYDAIRVCGPGPMMKAVAKKVAEWPESRRAHYCEVSLENKMACGLGVCLCCVENTKEGHKCVCSDGPVFDINDLNW